MVIGMCRLSVPPGADRRQCIATVGALPEIDTAHENQVRVDSIAGPDDVVVPALLSEVVRRKPIGRSRS